MRRIKCNNRFGRVQLQPWHPSGILRYLGNRTKIWPHLWIVLGQCIFFSMEPSSPAPTTSNWRRQPKSDPVKKMSKRDKGTGPKWKTERKYEGYNWKDNRKEDTEKEHQRRGLARPQNMFIESICTNTIYLYTYAHVRQMFHMSINWCLHLCVNAHLHVYKFTHVFFYINILWQI